MTEKPITPAELTAWLAEPEGTPLRRIGEALAGARADLRQAFGLRPAATTSPAPGALADQTTLIDAGMLALESCSKEETSAFEAWAGSAGYDMHEHPLHYLFMDAKTDAARQGWKAALRFASRTLLASSPAASAPPVDGGERERIAAIVRRERAVRNGYGEPRLASETEAAIADAILAHPRPAAGETASGVIAWMYETKPHTGAWEPHCSFHRPPDEPWVRNIRPLVQATAAPEQAAPQGAGETASGGKTERQMEAPIYEAFARYVGDADERASDFRMFATGYHAAERCPAPTTPKTDSQVWIAALNLQPEQLKHPEWLWWDDVTVSFGRWASSGHQAPYVRADIALATRLASQAPAAPTAAPEQAGSREIVRHVKRGTEYEVLGEAEAQVSTFEHWDEGYYRKLRDGCRITVYRCLKTDKLWCRSSDEFRDGRFVSAAARPHSDAEGRS